MDRDLAGMAVRSLKGHDSGRLYIVLRTEGLFLYLCDGRLKPREGPKKKKLRHVDILDMEAPFTPESVREASDADIRRALKTVRKCLSSIQEE